MPRQSDAGFEIDVRPQSSSVASSEAVPFRIAIFGDFSGRRNRGIREAGASLASRRPVLVDRDNFDEVLAALRPGLELQAGDGGRIQIPFSDLDDFHPDQLYRRLAVFESLRDLRARLADPVTFREAAKGLTGVEPAPPVKAPPVPEPVRPEVPSLTGGSLLDAMLDTETGAVAARPARKRDELRAYVQALVEPYLVPGKDPRQDEFVRHVDEAVAGAMRGLLHHPDFQELEAAWRGLYFLTRRLETGPDLKICIFDISRDELESDLRSASDLRETGFFRKVVQETVGTRGADPWALLVGLYGFGATVDDVDLLARIGMIARQAKAPFLAGALPGILGCSSLAETPDSRDWPGRDRASEQVWQTLREMPEAPWLGLALPRFLLRLPYGEDADAPEQFQFEEVSSPPVHEDYLWGNPALACACLLGQAFQSYGWKMRPGVVREIGKMPLHIYRFDGESLAKPCAEALLTDRTAELILGEGVMPLLSAKDSDRILLPRFQSVADPLKALAGRWM